MLNTSSHSNWGRRGMLSTGPNTGPATLPKATLHLSVNPSLGTSVCSSTVISRWEERGGLAPLPAKSANPDFSWALTHPPFPQQLRSALFAADLSFTTESYSKELFLSLFYWGGTKEARDSETQRRSRRKRVTAEGVAFAFLGPGQFLTTD